MGRHNRPRRPTGAAGAAGAKSQEPRPLALGLTHQVQEWSGEEWAVRALSASAATKVYRCPGCDHEIAVREPHVVVWPLHSGAGERRHWHRVCWGARERRSPTRRLR